MRRRADSSASTVASGWSHRGLSCAGQRDGLRASDRARSSIRLRSVRPSDHVLSPATNGIRPLRSSRAIATQSLRHRRTGRARASHRTESARPGVPAAGGVRFLRMAARQRRRLLRSTAPAPAARRFVASTPTDRRRVRVSARAATHACELGRTHGRSGDRRGDAQDAARRRPLAKGVTLARFRRVHVPLRWAARGAFRGNERGERRPAVKEDP
jgi:hypothetical protein